MYVPSSSSPSSSSSTGHPSMSPRSQQNHTQLNPALANYGYDPETLAFLAKRDRQRQMESLQEDYNRRLMDEYNEALLDRQRRSRRQQRAQSPIEQFQVPTERPSFSPPLTRLQGSFEEKESSAPTGAAPTQDPAYAVSQPRINNDDQADSAAQTDSQDPSVSVPPVAGESSQKHVRGKSHKSRNHHSHKRHRHGKKDKLQQQQQQEESQQKDSSSSFVENPILDIIDALFGGNARSSEENPFADLMCGFANEAPQTTAKSRREARNQARNQSRQEARKARQEKQQQQREEQGDVSMTDADINDSVFASANANASATATSAAPSTDEVEKDDSVSSVSSKPVLSVEEANAQLKSIGQSFDRCAMTYERLSSTLDKPSALTVESLTSRIHILNMTQLQLDDIVDKLDTMDEVPSGLKAVKHSFVTDVVGTAEKVEELTSNLSKKRAELKVEEDRIKAEKEEEAAAAAAAAAVDEQSSETSSMSDSDSDSMESYSPAPSPRPIRKVIVEEVPDDDDF